MMKSIRLIHKPKKSEEMKALKNIHIDGFRTGSGKTVSIELSYQTFGQDLHEAPVVMVIHALTGNSNVTGDKGWWNEIIGPGKCIDTDVFSVLAFNIPGNGYDQNENNLIANYKDFNAQDIAAIFANGIDHLGIDRLYAVIGGSVGGGLVWELAVLRPNLIEHIIPIASDWKSTDWVIANCFIQDNILNNSAKPLEDARMHAMTLYRTPESFVKKFSRTRRHDDLYNVESWLNYHGDQLQSRFQLSAYKIVNQVLKTIDITRHGSDFLETIAEIKSSIHIIAIDSDLLFKASENRSTFTALRKVRNNVTFGEIKSIHGHDAFLIEYDQLEKILRPVFQLHEGVKDQLRAS